MYGNIYMYSIREWKKWLINAVQLSSSLPSLKEQGIEQLYPSPPATDAEKDDPSSSSQSQPLNHAFYLLKISKSLLLNFLEFTGILSVAPEQFESKLEDLRNLFINAHHLLNLYRPHQARESLILMMEEQLDRTRNEIQEMDHVKDRVERLLEQLKTEGADALKGSQSDTKDSMGVQFDSKTMEEARQLWALLNEDEDQQR
jgi:mediator of RNA polymerase II transcription subunit 7